MLIYNHTFDLQKKANKQAIYGVFDTIAPLDLSQSSAGEQWVTHTHVPYTRAYRATGPLSLLGV
jgi:hypothetical protein